MTKPILLTGGLLTVGIFGAVVFSSFSRNEGAVRSSSQEKEYSQFQGLSDRENAGNSSGVHSGQSGMPTSGLGANPGSTLPLASTNPNAPGRRQSTGGDSANSAVSTSPSSDTNGPGSNSALGVGSQSLPIVGNGNGSIANGLTNTTPGETNASNEPGSGTNLDIEVPVGAKVPAVFYDDQPATQQQQAALDRIKQDFQDTVSNPPPGVSEDQAWEMARRNADEQYLILFGYKNYNYYTMQAAKEALREKKAVGNPAPQQTN